MTLAKALAMYVAQNNLAPKTQRKLSHRLNCWQRHSAARTVAAITATAFARFREAAQAAGLAVRTIEETVSDVGRICGLKDVGPRLRGWKRIVCRPVPEIEIINRAYEGAGMAVWPNSPKSRTPELQTVDNGTFWRAYLAVGFHTGLRENDMRRITWDAIGLQRIDWQASKTKRPHVFPVDDVLRRHLEPLRSTAMTDRVFPISDSQTRFVRAELKRISGDAGLTAQPLRRASLTAWAQADRTACEIIHGCGLGVLQHYLGADRILREAMLRRAWPVAFLTAEKRTAQKLKLDELNRLGQLMPSEQLDNLIKVGQAFVV